jgi:[acyl-carrier-protein] S-malonyltransferase
MGHDVIGRYSVADRLIADAEDILGYDVAEFCLEGLGRKSVPPRQEAEVIYILECAYAAVLEDLGFRPRVVSGHSLGNAAAGWVCGAYDFLTGLGFVTEVERLLETLIDGCGQGMGIILGLELRRVESLLAHCPDVWLANWNAPGQYVIGGDAAGIEGVLAEAARHGAKRARRLPDDRAVHTPLMRELAGQFREHLRSASWYDPILPLVNSFDGSTLRTSDEVRQWLGDFIELPVRWEATVRVLCQAWGSEFVEVGPGNLLRNLHTYIDRSTPIRTASDLVEQHAWP